MNTRLNFRPLLGPPAAHPPRCRLVGVRRVWWCGTARDRRREPAQYGVLLERHRQLSTAAYGVLKALFPNRSAQYQAAYEQRLAAIPDGQAKNLGLALGSEVAAEVVRLRANDGRNVALSPYVSGTGVGQFRSANPNPVFRHFPSIKPFSLNRPDQFRPAPPPALNSVAYAAAVNETRALGGTVSTVRTPEQLEAARFHTEPRPPAITRNLGRFASSTANVGDAARLMAAI